MISRVLSSAVLLVLAACGGKAHPAPPPPDPCETAAASLGDNSAEVPEGSSPELVQLAKDLEPKLRAVIVTRCQKDQWAPEVSACLSGATNKSDAERCASALTPAQLEGLMADLMKEMQPLLGEIMKAFGGAIGGDKEAVDGAFVEPDGDLEDTDPDQGD